MSNKQQYRDKLLEDRTYAIEAAKGDFIMEVTEAICEVLDSEGISKQELAKKIGKSKGLVSQLLNGSRNMTLSTMAEIAYALGYLPGFKLTKRIGEKHVLDCFEFEMKPQKCVYESKI